MTLMLSPLLVGWCLKALIGLLFLAHVAGQFANHVLGRENLKGMVPLFNMNGELSIPTWIASILLALCAALLSIIAVATARAGAPFFRWWAFLSLLFLYVALDEAVAIHELTISPLRDLFGVSDGWLYFAWVAPAAFALAIFAIAAIPFLRHLPDQTRRGFLWGGGLFVCGALGVELIGGWHLSTRGDGFLYEMIGGVEEVLEFEGAAVVLITLMHHYANRFGPLTLTFHEPDVGAPRTGNPQIVSSER